jgi:hypothetical protein
MDRVQTFTATEFKARCLEIFDQLASHKLARAQVTKRGKVVAILTPPEHKPLSFADIHGFMKGRVHLPPDFDLTEPILDEPFLADQGVLHE